MISSKDTVSTSTRGFRIQVSGSLPFRDKMVKDLDAELFVHRNEEAIRDGSNPFNLGRQKRFSLLKTQALLDALKAGEYHAAIGGVHREEEKSRAKERDFRIIFL